MGFRRFLNRVGRLVAHAKPQLGSGVIGFTWPDQEDIADGDLLRLKLVKQASGMAKRIVMVSADDEEWFPEDHPPKQASSSSSRKVPVDARESILPDGDKIDEAAATLRFKEDLSRVLDEGVIPAVELFLTRSGLESVYCSQKVTHPSIDVRSDDFNEEELTKFAYANISLVLKHKPRGWLGAA